MRTTDSALRSALIAQHAVGVAVCDADGVLIEYNSALASVIGIPYQRSAAKDWPTTYCLYDGRGEKLLRPEEVPLSRALRGERVDDQVVATRKPGCGIRFLRCNASQLIDKDGELAGAVVFAVDATEAILERRKLDRLRDRLVDTVNHELRTPTASMLGHVELLVEVRNQLPPDAAWSVDALARNLTRMCQILDCITDLADAATAPSESP